VLSTDAVPVAAAGWNSSFDSQLVLNTSSWPQIFILGPNHDINIDGRVASGISIHQPGSGGDMFRIGGSGGGNVSNLFISHLQLLGTSNTSGLSAGRYSFNLVPGQYSSGTLSNCTIDHCDVGPSNEAFRGAGWNGVTIQYCSIHDTTLDNIDHNDYCYFAGSVLNTTWRYNVFYNSPSDGILFESSTAIQNFQFYGNVCFNNTYHIVVTKSGNGNQTLYFFNNVFGGNGPQGDYGILSLQGTTSGCQIYDNIFYNSQNQSSGQSGVTSDYNAYYPSNINGQTQPPSSEPHSFVLSSLPFVNPAPPAPLGDFHLTAAGVAANPNLAKGLALTADGFINKDMDGNVRGAGGAWYIGAYQYLGTSAPTPMPPTNLRITASP
jgi:hypothetical protein